jgi:hypothetical protein
MLIQADLYSFREAKTNLLGTRVPTLGIPLAEEKEEVVRHREPGDGDGDSSTLPVD